MKNRRIGATDVMVHEIGYGGMQLSIDPEKRPPEAESIRMLQRAVDDLGVNFIDTADAYCIDDTEIGHNERLIARALEGERRKHVFIATKGGLVRPEGRWERNSRPEHLRAACEASLKALATDRIDLYQHHAIDPSVPLEDSIGTLADLQREGKIRLIGISNYSLDQLRRAMKEAEITSIQNQYSVMNRRDQEAIIEFCAENSITYIPWNPVGGRGNAPNIGAMFTVLQEIANTHSVTPHAVALAWLLQHSPAIIPIPGTRSFEHLAEDVMASDLDLSEEEIRRLDHLGDPD